MFVLSFFFFKQKTAYEMCISDWSSDVCSSDLRRLSRRQSWRWRRVGHRQAGARLLAHRVGFRSFSPMPAFLERIARCIVAFEPNKVRRESGRERGCKKVKDGVVAVTLTNTRTVRRIK